MSKILVKTGFGYYKDQAGRIVCRAILPAGDHLLESGYTYTEVADQAALDAIEVWIDPVMLEREKNEKKIADKIRKDAIKKLKDAGDLPGDYE